MTMNNDVNNDEILFNLDKLFTCNPAYSNLYAKAILSAAERQPEEELCNRIESMKTAANQTQDAAAILATLIRRDAITRTITVNGEPYDGTIEDLQKDETLPDRIDVEFFVEATEIGTFAAKAYEESTALAVLFAEKPQYERGFRLVLEACTDPDGKSTADLQSLLADAGVVRNDIVGAQELHASYFTGTLESYDALVWDRKRWRTTPKGAAVVSAS